LQIFCHFISFFNDFIDFVCLITVKIVDHKVASYESCDFTFLTVKTMWREKLVPAKNMPFHPLKLSALKKQTTGRKIVS
jgi:hypothetical protein